MSVLVRKVTELAESGYLPDALLRAGARRLIEKRRQQISAGGNSSVDMDAFEKMMRHSDIALATDKANEQHYEVPPQFFELVLGEHRKYSCCYWNDKSATLNEAEVAALKISAERANIQNGQAILDLGCGWGSMSLWIASNFPDCSVTSVSNSAQQRQYIEAQLATRNLTNVRVITADMNTFDTKQKFDRVVSIEMFEHMRNYPALFARISKWLQPDGLFFMHIFCHRHSAYEFVDAGPADWMTRHFFAGGIMPSEDLPKRFQKYLTLIDEWQWSGTHYEKTALAWLNNMDAQREAIEPILSSVYGPENVTRWWMRWRLFFVAVGELFGYRNGIEWRVGHYLFQNRDNSAGIERT